MDRSARPLIFAVMITLTFFFAGGVRFLSISPAAAQEGTVAQEIAAAPQPPFKLPFAQPSGPDTWLMAQPYGSTTGAYRQRFTTYGASGGIHFGVDLSAPCGTEVTAIADGVVFAVDGPFGSPPHNLMIDHPQLGYASMYGHLLEAPALKPGTAVKQGQVVALSGDSGETCFNRPHLHLEIRDLKHVTKYNPLLLIDANWQDLALIGNSSRDFARDLEEPRKWQSLYDQPEARTGGPIVNDFAYAWPFDWRNPNPGALPPASSINADSSPVPDPATLATLPIGRQLTTGNCCTQPYWNNDSTQVRFIDQPGATAPLGVWAVELNQPEAGPEFITRQLGNTSPDGAYMAYPNPKTGQAVVERLADGRKWEIDTQQQNLNFSPDSQSVLWTVSEDGGSFNDNREEVIWRANVDGSDARIVLQSRRVNLGTWLSGSELLFTRRIPGGSDVQLFKLSLTTGRETELAQLPQIRGQTLSPDRRYMVYYVSLQSDPGKNGTWLLDLQNPELAPQKLPFFGTYRWRDNERLVYVPFNPAATAHDFFEYNLLTGQTRALFPGGTQLTIANNDWRISPDGRKIVMVAARGIELDGLWVLELDRDS